MRTKLSVGAVAGMLVGALGVAPVGAAPARSLSPPPSGPAVAGSEHLDVFQGTIDLGEIATLRAAGVDPHEMTVKAATGNQADVEVVLSSEQAADLADAGVELEPKLIDGQTVAEAATLQAEAGFNVFRPYSGAGGLREEFEQIAADNPDITKLVVIGQTVNGQDIIALKVTKKASRERDGSRPATLFSSAQHAREWITPEMNRRLVHYIIDNYRSDRTIKQLVNTTEMWFVP